MSQLPYAAILKACLDHEIYKQHSEVLLQPDLQKNSPQIYQLGCVLKHLHAGSIPKTYTVDDLGITYKTLYPASQEALIAPLLRQINESEVSASVLVEFLQTVKQRANALKIAQLALAIAEGREEPEAMGSIQTLLTKDTETNQEGDFIDEDVEALVEKIHGAGLRWRLGSLNRALGPLRVGDFGFVFARPETGKTTFLASEVTYMASQATQPILWFNNEEQSEKVLLRCIQAALGKDTNAIFANLPTYKQQYTTITGGRIKFPRFELFNKRDIERLCEAYAPSLVVLDQIDKTQGFAADRDDLELSAIYEWTREMAKRFCPVIGICQAGSTAEGKRWLTMNDVNNSKTGKQGEADWILGIGKTLDEAEMHERFLHLSKNKLLGGSDQDPSMRHGKWSVQILPEVARYGDFQ